MRAWVSLAQISPKKRLQSCLAAYNVIIKMWESTVNAVNATVVTSLTDSRGNATDSSKKSSIAVASSANIVINTAIPVDLQGWIDFQPSESLKKCLQMSEETLNFTDTRVILTLYF